MRAPPRPPRCTACPARRLPLAVLGTVGQVRGHGALPRLYVQMKARHHVKVGGGRDDEGFAVLFVQVVEYLFVFPAENFHGQRHSGTSKKMNFIEKYDERPLSPELWQKR